MDPQLRYGLILGAIVGFALAMYFYMENQNPFNFLLVPFAALMGAGPWFLKPKDE